MKKLFFAAIAAMALVCTSNVFASRNVMIDDDETTTDNIEVPADSTTCDSTATAE